MFVGLAAGMDKTREELVNQRRDRFFSSYMLEAKKKLKKLSLSAGDAEVNTNNSIGDKDKKEYDSHNEGWSWFIVRLQNYVTKEVVGK